MYTPKIEGQLRSHSVKLPAIVKTASGIEIFGKTIKSLIFTTDLAIIRNNNADAIIAVYPFTPQPCIIEAILSAADMPIFCGVGGGTTMGARVGLLAQDAEFRGALGVVLNSPTPNETIEYLKEMLDIPVIVTIATIDDDYKSRIESGAKILNVSGGADTPKIVAKIRLDYPEFPIIATGGPTEDSIKETIEAGANAITYTPPSSAEIFKEMMKKYRNTK